MKTTSCGVLIRNAAGQLLVAHATGQRHWDIPKGGAEPGESPREAAVREVLEETGLVLAAEALREVGLFAYRSGKDLHLFTTTLAEADCDLGRCQCTSHFPHFRTGVLTPEVDEYRWVDLPEVPKYCALSMTALLRTLPGLEAIAGPKR
ncbi:MULTISPECIES: NUDIX domain-containing protein [unclassified Variovorax]|uniref:NUDIX domain-containing protein n=1 Tax=unclassified Variovorax TaxID=663243 RepID=UPI00076C9F35|nr:MULTISPECIES: NUDIX hydrolase [unclassified Variovorax]KWT98492.1 NTP pyrophosphohydrolase [Variovorax sp. WDL1]PNG49832.1 RNA pyrophosphohydrolase [Variovorax sp. B2]PNG50704.1 RNA pyrophosphohydrolase [Variovorax sp. B4]VTU42413.1 RNA pyrophosphohydrolase [Variovorax sp. PBL-H6]VTU43963.1 RNA pyrophosphohydrolase [Variovorax sp. SRS16]